jgi:thioredoxin-dependent peroxiredoxin
MSAMKGKLITFVITCFCLISLTGENMTMDNKVGTVTMKGNPMDLVGNKVKVGDQVPKFHLVANDMSTVECETFSPKVCVILTVPSLDTPVCDIEVRRFNEEASKLSPDIAILAVSMDLPFAQKRWCGAAGISRVQTLSDYRDASLGLAFGVLIKDLRLLARSVFVIDKTGKIRYIQIVKEVSEEPDYNAVLKAVKNLI